ncbi:L-threonylcarbamoyladenylate synthase [Umezawaea tangerina]|uniref:Threonylcarbamoyl-AMP synthase n=1 Tax=Umezawaea tangerina TaxID=84725 RepID=A0A2T0TH11_9PSEU|nr:L-threonylcarbamoyladenylate synthase [Umezawaea tangerina]PRY44986.1 L-threonylcarbamoyladenylate synthase [Umezawaea tangerina]
MRTAQIVLPDADGLDAAVALLKADQVCAFPTETVYGLGANALSETAISEVYRLKGRPSWNPLIVHVADADMARTLAATWPDTAAELARRFWPGPLTLVVDRADHVPGFVSAGSPTVAIRVPAHPVALALLEASGLPLAAPSANRSEGLSPTSADHVVRSLPDVPMVLDGGRCQFGLESTVVDVSHGTPRLLRPGALSVADIRAAVGDIDVPEESTPAPGPVLSPGMGKRHYAPRARVVLVPTLDTAALRHLGPQLGILTHLPVNDTINQDTRVELLPADPSGYGTELYAALHRLDESGVHTIAVLTPPDDEDWLAVRDRLGRAVA